MSDDEVVGIGTPRTAFAPTAPGTRAALDPASRRQIRVRRLRRERETAARRRLILTVSASSTGRWSHM